MTPDDRITKRAGVVRQQRPQLEVVLAQNAALLVLAVLLSACNGPQTARPTPTANSSATVTAAAQATQAAAPVWLALTVSVRGTAAQHDVQFSMQVTVHNRNPFPIALAGECSNPPIRITIANTASGFLYVSVEAPFCPNASASDLRPAIPAGSTYTWTYTYGYAGETDVVAGTYTVTADIHHWHAGTIEQQFTPNPPPWGTATTTTTVTSA